MIKLHRILLSIFVIGMFLLSSFNPVINSETILYQTLVLDTINRWDDDTYYPKRSETKQFTIPDINGDFIVNWNCYFSGWDASYAVGGYFEITGSDGSVEALVSKENCTGSFKAKKGITYTVKIVDCEDWDDGSEVGHVFATVNIIQMPNNDNNKSWICDSDCVLSKYYVTGGVAGSRQIYIPFEEGIINWSCDLSNVYENGGGFWITGNNGERRVSLTKPGVYSGSFVPTKGVAYTYTADGGDDGTEPLCYGDAYGSMTYTFSVEYSNFYSMKFMNQSNSSGDEDRFLAYFPTHQLSGQRNYGPIDGKKPYTIWGDDDKRFSYPMKVWYEVWVSRERTSHSGPFFTITNPKRNETIFYHNLRNITRDPSLPQSISGTFIIPAGENILVEMNAGMTSGPDFGHDCCYMIIYQIDDKPPGPPRNVKVTTGTEVDNIFHTKSNSGITIDWDEAIDDAPYFDLIGEKATSGIDYYEVSIGKYKVETKYKNTEASFDSSYFPEEGKVYQVGVKAYDKAGLDSTVSKINIVIDKTKPTSPIDLKPQNTINGCTKADPVIWTWGRSTDAISGVKQYHITVKDPETDAIIKEDKIEVVGDLVTAETFSYSCFELLDQKTYQCIVTAEDYAGNHSDPATNTVTIIRSIPNVTLNNHPIELNNGNLIFTWNRLGEIRNPGLKYEVAVTTSPQPPEKAQSTIGTNSYTHDRYSSKNTWYYWVRAIDDLGNRSSSWTMTGPFPEFEFTCPDEVKPTRNNKYQIDLSTRVLGKKFVYEVKLKGGVLKDPHVLELPGDGEWQWWLEVYECDSNGNKIETSKVITESFTIKVDTTPPSGSFGVFSADGKKDHTQVPTNLKDVTLKGIRESLSDVGIVSSGVDCVYLWNSLDNPDAEALPPSSAKYYPMDQIEKFPETGLYWPLQGLDGKYFIDGTFQVYINMVIKDKAGNLSDVINKVISFDNIAPGVPINFGHTHRQENGKQYLKYFWEAELDEGDSFKVSYLKADGKQSEEVTVTPVKKGDTYTGEYELNITDEEFGANRQMKLSVTAIDQADNINISVCENVYTLALPGTLTNFNEDYYYSNGQYKARFTYNLEGGVAKGQFLEVSKHPEFIETETEKIREVNLVGNQFIVDDLDVKGNYYYRLVATNNSTPPDRVLVNYQPYQVPNYGPVFPENTEDFKPEPDGFSTCNVVFSFPEAIDPNGDAIESYLVKVKAPFSNDYQPALKDEKGHFYLSLDKNSHGSVYYWYVESIDNRGGISQSGTFKFTVDANDPSLTIQSPARPFTNQKRLEVKVSDDLSGVGGVTYIKTDVGSNDIGDPIPVPLNNGIGYIDLPEGYYHLKVTATDRAGNNKSEDFNNLIVDHTKPQISSLFINLTESNGSYISPGTIPVWLTAIENGIENSGIKGVRYWITDQAGATQDAGQYIALSHGLEDFALTLTIPEGKENGKLYYLALEVYDRANNPSDTYRLTKPILLDTTPPQLSLTVNGLVAGGSGYYLNDLENLSVNLEAVDDATDHTETLAIFNDDGTQASGWDYWETIKNSRLIPGKKYRIAAKSVNQAGLESQVQSQPFTFDNSEPIVEVVQQPQTVLATGETASYIFKADDEETAIVAYRLAIGTAEQETALTKLIPENTDGWYEVRTNSGQLNLRIEIPSINDGTYQAIVEVANAAGLTKRTDAGTIIINNNRERLTVSDQGPYTFFTDELTGWWEYYGAETPQSYRYRIYRIEGANKSYLLEWTETNEREVTVKNLDLQTGAVYGFEVQAVFAGGQTITGSSPGVLVDGTTPEITKYNAPLYATPWNIGFSWEAKDDESGIKSVLAALGTDFQKTDVTKGWVEVNGLEAQLSCDVNGEPLVFDLENNNRYYLSLRVINGAGAAVDVIAPATIIDQTPPPVPVVMDQGAYINTNPIQPLEANWIWSGTDPESGVAYQWTILKHGEKVTSDTIWHDCDGGQKITLYMDETTIPPDGDYTPRFEDGKWYFRRIHGNTYYIAVKAVNGAGLTSIGYSNGIMVDATAPLIPKVILMDAVNLGKADAPEVNYITSTEELGLWIDSLDPESPIDQYLYSWNIASDVDTTERLSSDKEQIILTDEIINKNPPVEGEVNIFLGECSNEAILTSATGYSTGVVLDTGAPKIENVRGCLSGDKLLFDWEVIASISPVVQYQYQLLTEAEKDHPDPNLWLTAPDLSRRLIMDAQNIPDGKYCLVVRACNAAGTYSRVEGELNELGVSPTITIDRTPPVILENEFRHPFYGNQIIAGVHLKVEDKNPNTGAPGSGIHSYQYALGTRSNSFQFTDGWQDVFIQDEVITIDIPTEHIPHNTGVYLIIRVKDKAGLYSKTITSQRILIDHTAPSKPVLTYGQYTTSLHEIKNIGCESSDPESRIISYKLGVVTEVGGEWITEQIREWITEQNTSQINCGLYNLNLVENGVYYLAMQTQNCAGTWSEVGYSDKIRVDIIEPKLEFSRFGEIIVINQPPFNVNYTLSESAEEVTFTVTGENGISRSDTLTGEAGMNQYIFDNSENFKIIPQKYTITATAKDLAGNEGLGDGIKNIQKIRVNAPPNIILPNEIPITPGKPLHLQGLIIYPDELEGDVSLPNQLLTRPDESLQLNAIITDPDGVAGDTYTCEWLPGDGGPALSGVNHEYKYTVLGDYILTLTVTDKDGGKTTVTSTVKVRNTSSGNLHMDETWSGTHRIYGNVIVPAGIKLTIQPGTQILIDGIPGEIGYNHALIVKGTLNVGAGTSFASVLGKPDDWDRSKVIDLEILKQKCWRGILVEGKAILDGVTIRYAERGVAALDGAEVSLSGCTFENNMAGVHAYNSHPTISSCIFRNNVYGIKEDEGGRPTVKDCQFTENGVDYYHWELTEISLEQLKDLSGDSENQEGN